MLHPPQNDKIFCVDVSYFVQLVHYLGKLIILSSEPGSPRQTLEVNLYQTSFTRGFGNRFFWRHSATQIHYKWYKPGGTFAGHLRPVAGHLACIPQNGIHRPTWKPLWSKASKNRVLGLEGFCPAMGLDNTACGCYFETVNLDFF